VGATQRRSRLSNLEFLSLSNTGIEQVEPLVALDQLRSLYLDGNRIGDISALAGQRVIDDGDLGFTTSPGWLANVHPVSGTFQKDYRFIPSAGPLNPSPQTAQWSFTGVAPGSYAVLVTWPPSESRAAGGQYSIFDGDTATTPEATLPVDQKLAPSGSVLGGVAWQSLGVFSNTTGTLRVRLTDTAATNGTVAADAVRIIAVDAETGQDKVTLPALNVLSLAGNPLNNQAFNLYLGILRQRLGARLNVGTDAAPVLHVGPLRDGPSRAVQFDGIDDFVEVPSSPTLDIRRTMTLELWMQADRAADRNLAFPVGKDWMPLVQKSTGALGRGPLALAQPQWFHPAHSADTSGEEFVQTGRDGTIQPGQWYHVAGVIDRDGLRLFVHDAPALWGMTSGSVRPRTRSPPRCRRV
jgi:Leucine-rich repeat (LRR) protein